MIKTNHPDHVVSYNGTLDQLASDLGQKYASRFLNSLAKDIHRQSVGDKDAGHPQLSDLLLEISLSVCSAKYELDVYPEEPLEFRIQGFNGSIDGLARSVGNMKYNKTAEFIGYIADVLKNQSKTEAAAHLYLARDKLNQAWDKICKKHEKRTIKINFR